MSFASAWRSDSASAFAALWDDAASTLAESPEGMKLTKHGHVDFQRRSICICLEHRTLILRPNGYIAGLSMKQDEFAATQIFVSGFEEAWLWFKKVPRTPSPEPSAALPRFHSKAGRYDVQPRPVRLDRAWTLHDGNAFLQHVKLQTAPAPNAQFFVENRKEIEARRLAHAHTYWTR